ncbi:MAG: hypothetical protein JSR59_21770 [Proteobacteria bacterium]|nr:hypothetical protein [Pseudomonadota bacterium]
MTRLVDPHRSYSPFRALPVPSPLRAPAFQNFPTAFMRRFCSVVTQLDVTLQTRKLDNLSSKESLVKNSFTNIDRTGRLTTGCAVSRQLAHASSSSADSVRLAPTDGSLSAIIKALKLGRLMKYEYVPEFQGALYAPEPL